MVVLDFGHAIGESLTEADTRQARRHCNTGESGSVTGFNYFYIRQEGAGKFIAANTVRRLLRAWRSMPQEVFFVRSLDAVWIVQLRPAMRHQTLKKPHRGFTLQARRALIAVTGRNFSFHFSTLHNSPPRGMFSVECRLASVTER